MLKLWSSSWLCTLFFISTSLFCGTGDINPPTQSVIANFTYGSVSQSGSADTYFLGNSLPDMKLEFQEDGKYLILWSSSGIVFKFSDSEILQWKKIYGGATDHDKLIVDGDYVYVEPFPFSRKEECTFVEFDSEGKKRLINLSVRIRYPFSIIGGTVKDNWNTPVVLRVPRKGDRFVAPRVEQYGEVVVHRDKKNVNIETYFIKTSQGEFEIEPSLFDHHIDCPSLDGVDNNGDIWISVIRKDLSRGVEYSGGVKGSIVTSYPSALSICHYDKLGKIQQKWDFSQFEKKPPATKQLWASGVAPNGIFYGLVLYRKLSKISLIKWDSNPAKPIGNK